MPSSNRRIIRGNQASQYKSWDVELIGPHYDNHVDRLLTEISMEHPDVHALPKIKPLGEEEIRLQHWAFELKEREAQLVALEEEANQRGYAKGLKQGYETGYQEANQERQLLVEAAHTIEQTFEQFKIQLADKLLDLALLTSKKILADTLELHPDNAGLLLQQMLDGMQLDPQHITLRANANTLRTLEKQLGTHATLSHIRLVEDTHQVGNGFVLQHPEGEVDASLQTRWLRVIEALGKNTPLNTEDLHHE